MSIGISPNSRGRCLLCQDSTLTLHSYPNKWTTEFIGFVVLPQHNKQHL